MMMMMMLPPQRARDEEIGYGVPSPRARGPLEAAWKASRQGRLKDRRPVDLDGDEAVGIRQLPTLSLAPTLCFAGGRMVLCDYASRILTSASHFCHLVPSAAFTLALMMRLQFRREQAQAP